MLDVEQFKAKLKAALTALNEIEAELSSVGAPSDKAALSYYQGRTAVADARVCFRDVLNLAEVDGDEALARR